MSIIPVYLNSFSSVAPHYRGTVDRAEIDRVNRRENSTESDKPQKTASEIDETSKRSSGMLIVRVGDIVSNHGDVFSLSRDGKQDVKPTQVARSKEDTAKELTEDEKQQVSELKQRDAEVKAHEAAHMGAAGGLARGGASYEYQKGPDGRNYVVGGEVSIDSSPVTGDPNATIAKAQQIRSASLAPANPSSQDHKVAAKASQMEVEALQEILKKEQNLSESDRVTNSHSIEDEENTHGNPQSQYFSNTAVTKFLAQSHKVATALPPAFQTFA